MNQIKQAPFSRKRCPNCRAKKLKKVTVDHALKVAGTTFVSKMPATKCSACGETIFASADVNAFHLAVAVAVARSGLSTGGALVHMRKVLGLRAAELAKLLFFKTKDVTQWERSGRIEIQARALLGLLVVDHHEGRTTTRDVLRAVRKPKKLGRRCPLTLRW
jgi:putative zinc finger/helix-turn-helix YgiT family protein